MTQAFSTYMKNNIGNWLFTNVTFPTKPATVYISLHSADPGGTGANELTSTNSPGYARIGVSTTTGFNAGVDYNGGRLWDNVANITFPVATLATKTLTAATVAGTIATFTTSTAHGYLTGDRVTVSGVTPAEYNGTWTLLSTPLTTTFTADIGTTPGAGSAFGITTKNWIIFTHVGAWDALTVGNFFEGGLWDSAGIAVLASEQWYLPAGALDSVIGPTA